MAPSFLLLHIITNEKTLKFTQIGRLLSASRASPQKHVPTTLVGIPVDIYTLSLPRMHDSQQYALPRTTAVSLPRMHDSQQYAVEYWQPGTQINAFKSSYHLSRIRFHRLSLTY